MLYIWLYPFHKEFSFLNVFRYQSFRIIYAAVTAFLIAFVLRAVGDSQASRNQVRATNTG